MIASRKFIIGITIALLIVVVGFIASREVNHPSQIEKNVLPQSGGEIPDLALKDFEGNAFALRSMVSTPLVINSWAVWCPFCKKEIPDFAAVQKEYEGRVRIIAIDRAEPLETVKEYTDGLGVTNDLLFLLDPPDSFYRAIGGFVMPETIFVDARGIIADHERGPMEIGEMRKKIKKLLEI